MGFWLLDSDRLCPNSRELEAEEERAAIMGRFALAIVAARSVRLVSLRSWPHKALLLLDGEAEARDTLAALRSDYENFQRLQRFQALGNSHAAALVRRSVFGLPTVRQLCLALQGGAGDGTWVVSPSLRLFLQRKSERLTGFLICEDGFNAQKNHHIVKGKRRYMMPQKASALLLTQEVLTHSWGFQGSAKVS